MSTQFSRIVGAIVDVLQADPAVCPKVYRARPDSIPDQFDQAVNVQWEQGIAGLGTIRGAPLDWATKVSVDCYARSPTDTGDVAVDPLLSAVFERLAQDTTLGGLIDDLQVAGIEAENSTEGKKTGWVRLTYIAQHRTDNGTLN
jgi:hypothetical protein